MDGTEPISNTADIIDSRDIIARIEFLESIKVQGEESRAEGFEDESVLDEAEEEELTTLLALAKEGEDYFSDWPYGEALIHDAYFEDYARNLAEDIGAIDRDAAWPNTYIDWERAADALRMDYTSIEFDGQTYWGRS